MGQRHSEHYTGATLTFTISALMYWTLSHDWLVSVIAGVGLTGLCAFLVRLGTPE